MASEEPRKGAPGTLTIREGATHGVFRTRNRSAQALMAPKPTLSNRGSRFHKSTKTAPRSEQQRDRWKVLWGGHGASGCI